MKIHIHGIKQELNQVNGISSTISLSHALEKGTHFRSSVRDQASLKAHRTDQSQNLHYVRTELFYTEVTRDYWVW